MRRTVATSSLLSFSTVVNALQSGVEPRHDVPQPLVHLGLDPLQERPGLAQARCQVTLVDPLAGRHQALLQGFESGALHASEARGLTFEAVQLTDLVAALRLALLHDGGLECAQIGVVAVLETVHGVADALQQGRTGELAGLRGQRLEAALHGGRRLALERLDHRGGGLELGVFEGLALELLELTLELRHHAADAGGDGVQPREGLHLRQQVAERGPLTVDALIGQHRHGRLQRRLRPASAVEDVRIEHLLSQGRTQGLDLGFELLVGVDGGVPLVTQQGRLKALEHRRLIVELGVTLRAGLVLSAIERFHLVERELIQVTDVVDVGLVREGGAEDAEPDPQGLSQLGGVDLGA